jgi:pyridoxal phosphate enzyme (YggS family)
VAAGRSPQEISIVAVSKMQPRERVDEAIAAGQIIFGENRVQEAEDKFGGTADSVELHLIGHLQSNKARFVPGLFSWVDSVDSLRIAEALSRRASDAGTRLAILLQYDSSGEETKSGYRDEELLLEEAGLIASLPSLDLRGIMTIGPNTADVSAIRTAFVRTRRLFERLRRGLEGEKIDVLSMGMSADFTVAIGEGSTQVRVGSAIFGPRQ